MGLSNYISLFVSAVMFGVWGSISDRFGRKWLLVFCLSGVSLSLFLSAMAKHIVSLIILRGITAIMSSAIFPITKKIITDVLPPSTRGQATVSFVIIILFFF